MITAKLFECYHIDGNIIVQSESCDYLIFDVNNSVAYFIELKGSDLSKAIKQIDTTVEIFKNQLANCVVNARIVIGKVTTPNLRDSAMAIFERKLKKMNGNLLYSSSVLTENL